jgi:hypothetical protein
MVQGQPGQKVRSPSQPTAECGGVHLSSHATQETDQEEPGQSRPKKKKFMRPPSQQGKVGCGSMHLSFQLLWVS